MNSSYFHIKPQLFLARNKEISRLNKTDAEICQPRAGNSIVFCCAYGESKGHEL